MDGWSVFFIVFFGIGAAVPAIWSIIGLVSGKTQYWPGVFGTIWALGLLTVTIVGITTNWGGCSSNRSASSPGAIICAIGDKETDCKPDYWKLECHETQLCGKKAIPPKAFCPPPQKPVFPFCERIRFESVKQPWATWSDLAFVAAGLWLMWYFHFFERTETTRMAGNPPVDNPMLMIGVLSVIYGMITIFMGPPSQWFHASMKDWGGWFDTMSVVAWMGFNAVYVSYALIRTMWGNGRATERTLLVLVFWFVLVFICGVIAKWPDARLYTYFIAGVPWGIAEFVYLGCGRWCDGVKYRRKGWLFGINFVLLLGTMTLWSFYNPDFHLFTSATACQSREGFPGHALFHILASFSTVLTFFSFASERKV